MSPRNDAHRRDVFFVADGQSKWIANLLRRIYDEAVFDAVFETVRKAVWESVRPNAGRGHSARHRRNLYPHSGPIADPTPQARLDANRRSARTLERHWQQAG